MAIATCMAVLHAILCGFERFAKRPISHCKTAHFIVRNGPFRNTKRPISQMGMETAAARGRFCEET